MNSLLEMFAQQSWVPVMTAFILPPVPFLIFLLMAATLLWRKRGLGWLCLLFGVAGLWFAQCEGTGQILAKVLLKVPPALSDEAISALRKDVQAKQNVSIAVLGAGAEAFAPEYGVANLSPSSIERLRYGIWLSKRTGVPLGFSGGIARGQDEDAMPEASVAARIAGQEFGRKLQWTEIYARDTHENAERCIALLRQAGVKKVIIVTHGWHMPRAQRDFTAAARADIEVIAAPMGLSKGSQVGAMRWIPSMSGAHSVRVALLEWLGALSGT